MREVDEELRRERLNKIVSRYGWAIVGGIILVLGAIGGYIWWQDRQQKQAATQGEALLRALTGMEAGNRNLAASRSVRSPRAMSKAIELPPCSRACFPAGRGRPGIRRRSPPRSRSPRIRVHRRAYRLPPLVRQTALGPTSFSHASSSSAWPLASRASLAWHRRRNGLDRASAHASDRSGRAAVQADRRGPECAVVDSYKGRSDGRVIRFQRRP